MSRCNDIDVLQCYDDQLDDLEVRLQKLWGFPEDPNYIKFWNRPKCSCPKMDNDDRYPYGHYVIVDDCPLHGRKIDE